MTGKKWLTLFLHHVLYTACGNSSVGRAQPCQGWGREFESRFPLQIQKSPSRKIRAFFLLILLYFLKNLLPVLFDSIKNIFNVICILWPRCDHGVPTTIKMVSINLKCLQSITTFRAFFEGKKSPYSPQNKMFFTKRSRICDHFTFWCDQTSYYHFDYYQFS